MSGIINTSNRRVELYTELNWGKSSVLSTVQNKLQGHSGHIKWSTGETCLKQATSHMSTKRTLRLSHMIYGHEFVNISVRKSKLNIIISNEITAWKYIFIFYNIFL